MLSIRIANNVLSLERCSLGASQRLEILWVQVYTHCRVESIRIGTVLWLGPVLVICFPPELIVADHGLYTSGGVQIS